MGNAEEVVETASETLLVQLAGKGASGPADGVWVAKTSRQNFHLRSPPGEFHLQPNPHMRAGARVWTLRSLRLAYRKTGKSG